MRCSRAVGSGRRTSCGRRQGLLSSVVLIGLAFGCSRQADKPNSPPPVAAPARPAVPAALAPPEPSPAGLASAWKRLEGFGFKGPSDLKLFLAEPEPKWGREHAWVAHAMGDWPGEQASWHRLAAADPTDFDAALREIEVQVHAGNSAALDAVAKQVASTAGQETSWRGSRGNAEAIEMQCMAAWQLGQLPLVKKTCFPIMRSTTSTAALRSFAESGVAAGDGILAPAAIQQALNQEHREADLWFVDAAALDVAHDTEDSHRALETALRLDPRHEPALRSYLALDKAPKERMASRLRRFIDAGLAG